MSISDLRATQRTQATCLGVLDPTGIDDAIERLEADLAKLRKARELVAERERLRADLARLDQSIAGVIAVGASPARQEESAPAPTLPTNPTPSVKTRRKVGRPAVLIEYKGRAQGIPAWAKDPAVKAKGITELMLRHRLGAGWPVERALTEGRFVHIASVDDEARERKLATKDQKDSEAAVAAADIDVAAAGIVSGPALQKKLDEMEGKPLVLPAGMSFVFDPAAQAASVPTLKAETVRRQRGGKQRLVEFVTTASRNHVHVAVVDHFGDGQTKPDSTGHVHRLARWKMIEAHRHEHGLAMTARTV